MWTEEMKRWLDLCHHMDYLQEQYEMADVMGNIDSWRKDRDETVAERDSLFSKFTEQQKRILLNC